MFGILQVFWPSIDMSSVDTSNRQRVSRRMMAAAFSVGAATAFGAWLFGASHEWTWSQLRFELGAATCAAGAMGVHYALTLIGFSGCIGTINRWSAFQSAICRQMEQPTEEVCTALNSLYTEGISRAIGFFMLPVLGGVIAIYSAISANSLAFFIDYVASFAASFAIFAVISGFRYGYTAREKRNEAWFEKKHNESRGTSNAL